MLITKNSLAVTTLKSSSVGVPTHLSPTVPASSFDQTVLLGSLVGRVGTAGREHHLSSLFWAFGEHGIQMA